MSKNKKNTQPKAPPLARRLLEGLFEANDLFKQGQLAQSSQKLVQLQTAYPNQYEVLALMADVSSQQKDFSTYEWVVYQLARLKPGSPEISISLAGAYMQMRHPALALRTYQKIIKRWPAHPSSALIRQSIEELRTALLNELKQPDMDDLADEELLELAVGHDEVRFFMSHNQIRQCKQVAEKLLKTYPNLIPVLNNLAQVYLSEGNYAEARRLAQQVLENEPENIHALSHMVRILYLSGDFARAREMSRRQAASPSQARERLVRLAESYSLLDEKERLLELYEQAKQAGELEDSTENALLLHYVATALASMGKEKQARSLWETALQYLPSFDAPRENLADLEKPAGERNGPWAYGFDFWVTPAITQEMVRALSAPVKQKDSAGTENAMIQLIQRHPELLALLPHYLARGDNDTREFAIRLMKMAETPELVALLKGFSLSKLGTDQMRLDVSQFLSKQGHLASGNHRMWINGQWTTILQLNFEITSDPIPNSQFPAVNKLSFQAIEALHTQDGAKAQALLEEALAIEETPSMLNNLALALEMQGKAKQAHEMAGSIHTRFPDYFFGISAEARKATIAGDFEKAHTLLDGLMRRQRMHITEYDALCEAQIHLALARENQEVARSWLQMWEKVNPEDQRLMEYRLMLDTPKLLGLMRDSIKK